MSSKDWLERVRDILDAIGEIESFVAGMDAATFAADLKTLRAVELAFVIIGEAANRIPADVQAAHPNVPWTQMKAMRDRLVHVYFAIDPRIVWDTLANDLPPLKQKLAALLPPAGAEPS